MSHFPWRLLLHGPASPARNMAIDEALLRELPATQAATVRLYLWDSPAISLGYFQNSALALANRPWIRRYTGGGLVDHAADLTYTIVAPKEHPWMALSIPESYALIHRGVQAALAAIGVESLLTPNAASTESEACFQKPVRFDLVPAHGSDSLPLKLGGAAQRRTREGMLHQGSVLPPSPDQRASLYAAFPEAFARHLELGPFTPGDLTPAEQQRADALERDRYSTIEWNYSKS